MVTLLEVMITSQVTITSQEMIVTSPINEQMVEALNVHQVMSMMICQGKLLQIPPKNLGSQEQRDLFRSQ